jgi:hypothetical protein
MPNSVIREHLLGFVDAVTKLCCPLIDVVEKADWQVLMDTSRTNISGVESRTGDTLIELLKPIY